MSTIKQTQHAYYMKNREKILLRQKLLREAKPKKPLMIHLNQNDFKMKIIEDIFEKRNGTRVSVFECCTCKKHLKLHIPNVRSRGQTECKTCSNKTRATTHGLSKTNIYKANKCHKRRYLRNQKADGTLPLDIAYPLTTELQHMLNEQNNKCIICNCHISHGAKNIHLDHVKPLSKGGEHSITNVQWLCATCNLQKGTTFCPTSVV